jgi:hypothetical protein
MVDRDWSLYNALAAVSAKPVAPPRAAWPTWYISANTGTLYARTRWDDTAVWLATECHGGIKTDHRHANAGTFALSRGKDDVIVDPTPYGSQSTLTTNAPTVVSAHFPKDYPPSQGLWGEKVGYDFVTSRASGVVAARCNYADAYKFQHRESDVPEAVRDFVLVPSADGKDAALIVIDRADTTAEGRAMHLRFRTPGKLELAGDVAKTKVGTTQLVIASVARSGGKTALGTPSHKDCYKGGTVKGQCDAARFPVTDYRVQIPGPRPTAVHLISATGATPAVASPLSGDGYAGVRLGGVRDATIIWRTRAGSALSYAGAPGTHIILDATDASQISAKPASGGCAVSVTGADSGTQKPLVATLDGSCTVTPDPEAAAASAVGTKPARARPRTQAPRSGCCAAAEVAPGQCGAMVLVVAALLARRRRSPVRR